MNKLKFIMMLINSLDDSSDVTCVGSNEEFGAGSGDGYENGKGHLKETVVKSDQVEERAIVAFASNCIIFGYSTDENLGQITINKAQYCYYYAAPDSEEKKGFMALAKYGPADGSKVSSPVDHVKVDATCIINATTAAISVWESSKWK